ncbi:cytidylyltransferase domain-containing protein [Rathayibacter sp. KR2-224]|uniref:cytidylyltransferase domain-containing protein n=1 Tax=Rathayibacter sp. KR2-224 TaxID=3400913 RepID=UPI003C011C1C
MRSPVRVVAVIPARAGSVGVPDKNLRTVGGVPLVQRAVRTALATASVDHVVVSTDGLEIASLAAEAGAGVVMRPAALSTGVASSESAITHTLDVLEERGAEPEVVVFLQSTSPFTRPEDVDAAVARVRSGECDSVFSAAQTHAFIWEVDARGAAYGVNHDPNVRRMRQDLAPQYRETGAFYVLDAQGYRRAGHRFFGRVGVAVVAEEIDIDTERDLAVADALAPLLSPAVTAADATAREAAPAAVGASLAVGAAVQAADGAHGSVGRAPMPAASGAATIPAMWSANDIGAELDAELESAARGAEMDGLAGIQAVVTDFDGVHTDDTVIVDQNGIESVAVDRRDGLGVRMLLEAGIPVVILSSETNPVVAARAAKLGVPAIQGVHDKGSALREWAADAGVELDRIAYLGNDVNDLGALRAVGWPFVVRNAHPMAVAVSRRVLDSAGGAGAVRELAELIVQHKRKAQS